MNRPRWQDESFTKFMYDSAENYAEHCGQPTDGPYFREMIDDIGKRDRNVWPGFVEFFLEEVKELLESDMVGPSAIAGIDFSDSLDSLSKL